MNAKRVDLYIVYSGTYVKYELVDCNSYNEILYGCFVY